MNRKYFVHFTWIITVIMFIYAFFCVMDGVSLMLPFMTYVVAMIIYTVPMTFIKSKEAKVICITFQNEIGKEQIIEQIICNKTKRFLEYENNNKKIFRKKNKYLKWLTNEVTVNIYNEKIELFVPSAYKKYFSSI